MGVKEADAVQTLMPTVRKCGDVARTPSTTHRLSQYGKVVGKGPGKYYMYYSSTN